MLPSHMVSFLSFLLNKAIRFLIARVRYKFEFVTLFRLHILKSILSNRLIRTKHRLPQYLIIFQYKRRIISPFKFYTQLQISALIYDYIEKLPAELDAILLLPVIVFETVLIPDSLDLWKSFIDICPYFDISCMIIIDISKT